MNTSRAQSPDTGTIKLPHPPSLLRKRKPRVAEILAGALNENVPHRYDVRRTLRGRPNTFGAPLEIGPHHSRIADVEKWFNALHYDPKEAQNRKEIRRQEQQQIAESRRRLSSGTTRRRLLMLSAALRSDMEIFVNHLLDYGTAGALGRKDLENSNLTKESYLQLKELFDILDLDHSGTLTFDELRRASVILGRESYDAEKFRRLDKNRSGSIDFLEMLKVFFPNMPMRTIARFHKENQRLADNAHRARDRLAPDHVREIDDLYTRLDEQPGGCCFSSLMSLMSPWMRNNEHIVREVFDFFDDDGNGVLTSDEFCEMMKFSYPPYCREHSDSDKDDDASAGPGSSPNKDLGSSTKKQAKMNTNGFSMRQIALNRWRNVMEFKLPDITTYDQEQQHTAHPRVFEPSNTHQLRVQNRMDTIVGKAVMAQYEGDRARKELQDRVRHRGPGTEEEDAMAQLMSELPTIGSPIDPKGRRVVPALRLQLEGVVPQTLQRSFQLVQAREKKGSHTAR